MRRALVLGLIVAAPWINVSASSAQGGWVLWQDTAVDYEHRWRIISSATDHAGCMQERESRLAMRFSHRRALEEFVEGILPGKVYRSEVTTNGMRYVTTRNQTASVEYHCFQAGMQPR